MRDIYAPLIAIASLVVSLYTLWLTQLRRGQLRMTQPTLLFLGRDGSSRAPKIFLRSLLFSTSIRGVIVESMFLRLAWSSETFKFDFWAHGDGKDLSPGSGLFIGQNGIACNHHFVLREPAETHFVFCDGDYRAEIFAAVVGRRRSKKLLTIEFNLTGAQAAYMTQLIDAGIFYNWDADTREYVGTIERESRPRTTVI